MCHTNKEISALLNRGENAIIHDRHLSFDKPIAKWFSLVLNKTDLVHLVKNCAQYVPGKHNLKPLITAAMARTKTDHDKAWDTLAEPVKTYIADVPKEKYCNYKAFERQPPVVLNDSLTSNNAESEMNRAKTIGARHTEPLVIMMKYCKLLNKIMNEGRALANDLVTKNKKIIPYAEKLWNVTTSKAGNYKVQLPISNLGAVIVAYDGLNSIDRIVNLKVEPATCTCLAPQQVGLPCGHVCAAYQIAFRLSGVTVNKDYVKALFHPQYAVDEFSKAFDVPSLVLPNIQSIRKDDTIAPNIIIQKGRKQTKRHLSALERSSNKKKRQKHYSTINNTSSVGVNSLLHNKSEIEEASQFIDASALAITNMNTDIENFINTANTLKNNSTYLNNDAIFTKVTVALNNLKSSLQIHGSKINKQIGLIKQNAGIVDHNDDDDNSSYDENESEEVCEVITEDEKLNELEADEIDDDPQDVEAFEEENGDMKLSDPHDIVILPDIDVEEEGDEFNLSLMLPSEVNSSSNLQHP